MVPQSRDQRQVSGAEDDAGSGYDAEAQSGLDADGDDSALATAGSQRSVAKSQASSQAGSTRLKHVTRAQSLRVQIHQKEQDKTVLSADDVLQTDESIFLGLIPEPRPHDSASNKKRLRTIEEVIKDNDSPVDRDKLFEELEDMDESHKRKKLKIPLHLRNSEVEPADSKDGTTTGPLAKK
ncbi:hypothetical protein BKA67DRAFT_652590 [Truncatella angustata]|uniref:Uncharacterized protein n=1 Tax=Truncatella angustata TaxID=152316 RepID=A0A9P9A2Q9_9PEZI|nr:uncharacterized protein BKA67DRAFT_652590 [Truncatella angustata]KAH6659358.1 hypothetical protein BKA67DRAFT_652590 [Truncatella angustata]KAH8195495.1 hypothetical protein TruAng_010347 [Truncatella angustata]